MKRTMSNTIKKLVVKKIVSHAPTNIVFNGDISVLSEYMNKKKVKTTYTIPIDPNKKIQKDLGLFFIIDFQ